MNIFCDIINLFVGLIEGTIVNICNLVGAPLPDFNSLWGSFFGCNIT